MSTTIPIQDLDPSVNPPNDHAIHAVVTLSWPYSSSTRQCALLLSERDFRLRARGGQIRVKFSGPAARAVAQGKLGIGDEVVLELGAGEWASGAAVHVPGKSVGELHFGKGVQLRVQKDGGEDVHVNVADDAVDEDEQETSQMEVTPVKKTSPASTFRSSIGRAPGSAAIYSSPAYMRKAARFSYLDGISRLFEDEWDNQDLPRKKARTSLGEVKSWKVVDRTPSPEPSPLAAVVVEDEEEMLDASQGEEADVRNMLTVEPGNDQEPTAEMQSVRSSPTPAPIQELPQPASPTNVTSPLSSPLELLATEALAGQQPEATITTSTLPTLEIPSSSPTPQQVEPESLEEHAFDPTTPRLIPLASTALPSTTPQISPLATRNAFTADTIDDRDEHADDTFSEQVLPSDGLTQQEPVLLTSPNKATESLLDQLKSTTGESELNTEPVVPEEDASAAVSTQWESDDLAEEDRFSDDEADEVLSAYENDAELMPEDDAEDVFDADELEGEEPSDDDTNEDLEMYNPPAEELLEESSTEKDSDIGDQASLEDQMDSEMTAERRSSIGAREMSQQPGFAPASTLLNAAETPAKAVQQRAANESDIAATPPKMPFFGFDGAVPSTEDAEVTTPAAKPTGTPKSTPQSARDKVMKRTFHSLFGLKGSPSPEKEDPVNDVSTVSAEANTEQGRQNDTELNATQIEQANGNEMIDSQPARADTVDVSSDAAIETAMPEAQEESAMMTDAGPQEVQDVTNNATEVPDETTQDIQDENSSPEAAPSALEHSPELIKLDSSSDAGDGDALMAEAEADHPMNQPTVSGPMPQKRSRTKGPEMDLPDVAGSGGAEITATAPEEHIVEPAEPETTLTNAEEQSNQVEEPEVERLLPVENPQEMQAISSPAANADILDQDDFLPATTPEPTQPTLDAVEQPLAVSPKPESPEPEVEESRPVDIELQEQSQHEPLEISSSPAEGDVAVAGDEVSRERSEHLQSDAALQDDESKPASPVKESVNESEAQVVDLLQEEDVEMLDGGQQESDLSQASFQSQMAPELDVESAPAESEKPTFSADVVQIEGSAQEPPQEEDDVEMMDGGREEVQSSHVSLQSQVLQDSADAPRSDLHENSSRPASRDTVEDFSPMVLGSMPQRVADIVSDDSALKRLQELQSEDGDAEITGTNETITQSASMADLVEEDLLEQTPTRSAKVQAVEVELAPTQSHTISPVNVTRTVHEQQPTPQATLEGDVQDPSVEDEEVAAVQENTVDREGLSASDMEALKSQLQTELVDDDGLQSARALSPEVVEQRDLADIAGDKDEQANLALPLSPSATQPAEPETQLSHANLAQTVMQPTPATPQPQSSMQPGANLTNTAISEDPEKMSQVETREQIPAELHEDPATMSHLQSTNMPPPEQTLPPKTPARRSLRSRLSNVPDVISAWFSPKRSSIAAQDSEEQAVVETPKATEASANETPRTTRRRASRASGLSTAHAYFTSLASLSQHVNPSSQQAGTVDVLAVVTDFTKEPERAKGGPRDYYTICRVTDPSMPTSTDVRVEVYRPWKAVLPAAEVGDVVLLRSFVVKSKDRQAYLLSTDTSAWCVWRFAEHSKATARGGAALGDDGKPVWARRMSHFEVREEVKGPPVEYGVAEKEQVRKLRDWWVETHGETQEGAPAEAVDKEQDEEEDVEL